MQEAIRDYIIEQGLRSGEPLPSENELAKQLGVSRNSVREAVKALESSGTVESRRGAGLFVGDFSFEPLIASLPYGLMQDLRQLADLIGIRRVLEVGMLPQAIETMTPGRRARLEEILGRMKAKAEEGASFPEEDRAFHYVLFEGLENKMLLRLLDVFWLAFRRASDSIDLRDPDPMSTYSDHRRVFEAVTARDLDAARAALDDKHYAGVLRRVKAAQSATDAGA